MSEVVNSDSKFSTHLIDPELAPGLQMFAAGGDLDLATIPEQRGMMIDMFRQMAQAPLPEALSREECFIPGPEGAPDVRVLIYRPLAASAGRAAILHIHGGGYVSLCPELNDANNRQLSLNLDCVIVSVDYRLAPETVYPGAINDCYAALQWLHANAESLGIDAARIAVAGESAGGGLAAALCLMARDRGDYPICFQCLSAPMIDDRTGNRLSVPNHVGEFIWTVHSNQIGWRALLGGEPGGENTPAYAAAARAKDLAKLPPTFIYVGSVDLFVAESIEYAQRLVRAGVPIELHVYPGAYHGFEMMADSEVAKVANGARENALRCALKSRPVAE